MTEPVFAERPGAVVEGGVLQHLGEPMREQRLLRDGTAVSPLDDRAVIEVAGPDRLTWLDSVTSQAMVGLRPGQSTELLVLDPQGRVEHAAGVFDDGASTWLIVDRDDVDALRTWLARMVFRAQVTVAERDELVAVGFFDGGAAAEVATAAAATPAGVPLVWADPWSAVQAGGHQYSQVPEHPAEEYAWRIALVEAVAISAFADVPAAGALAAEALRVAAWRPRLAADVDERSIPHELDWIRSAVHLNKGCYRGQETVAKVHNLGHPPRRLALLHLDGSDAVLPTRGDAVLAGDREVGAVTSVVRHFEDGPLALAVLSRRAPEGDLVVRTGETDVAAAQQVIVPADAGATADVPRITRLSRRPEGQDPRHSSGR